MNANPDEGRRGLLHKLVIKGFDGLVYQHDTARRTAILCFINRFC